LVYSTIHTTTSSLNFALLLQIFTVTLLHNGKINELLEDHNILNLVSEVFCGCLLTF